MKPALLVTALAFALASVAFGQDPSPSASPGASASPAKHRARKKADVEASASPTAAPDASASASPAKRRARAKKESAATTTPAAAATATASPAAKRSYRKKETAMSPAPTAAPGSTPAPAASPERKSGFGSLFGKSSTPTATPMVTTNSTRTNPATSTGRPAAGGGNGKVWVNTETHIYHKEGSRFYGTTKQGKYMTEDEAMKAGNKAAKSRE